MCCRSMKINVIAESNLLRKSKLARNDKIKVDAFTLNEYMQGAEVATPEKLYIAAKPLTTALVCSSKT